MRKYRGLLLLFIAFALINVTIIIILGLGISPLSGHEISTTAAIGIFIIKNVSAPIINILSPINGSVYNFNIGSNYTLDLNVTSDSQINGWSYDLIDLKHGRYVYNNVNFTPNTVFNAARWGNRLIVYGKTSDNEGIAEAYFDINVPNSPPIMGNISNHIMVCEGNFLSYEVNVTDIDEDDLIFQISPSNPFFLFPDKFYGEPNVSSNIVSPVLKKENGGSYLENLSVSDGQYVDSKTVNISVIEINNLPQVDSIGARTIWNNGSDRTFKEQLNVVDIEDGDQYAGNLTLNLTFLDGVSPFFVINKTGYMSFTANVSYLGVYNLSICVKDKGIMNKDPNISLCGQDGKPFEVCFNFSLTITNRNRPPNITSWNPENLSLIAKGLQKYYFNISKYDPDGTYPDSYWYIDDKLVKRSIGNDSDSYIYSVPCDIGGEHNLTAKISDGLLNDSITWNLTIQGVSCPTVQSGGGAAGGGGGGPSCYPKVVCSPWEVCTNLEGVFKKNSISNGDYIGFKNACLSTGFNDNSCGYQLRSCNDLNSCNYTFLNESEAQFCEYVQNPSCSDGVKNCHDKDCEVLVDCGGPCQACATCSDEIKNQGELGIDCGGPCPSECPVKLPILKKEELKSISYILISILLIILIIIIILRIIKIAKIKKELGELRWYELFKRKPEQK